MGVGILPTFKIFRNSSLVSEVKGAKYDELVKQIEKARLSTGSSTAMAPPVKKNMDMDAHAYVTMEDVDLVASSC